MSTITRRVKHLEELITAIQRNINSYTLVRDLGLSSTTDTKPEVEVKVKRKYRRTPASAPRRWTKADERALIRYFKRGHSYRAIGMTLGRTEKACMVRHSIIRRRKG